MDKYSINVYVYAFDEWIAMTTNMLSLEEAIAYCDEGNTTQDYWSYRIVLEPKI